MTDRWLATEGGRRVGLLRLNVVLLALAAALLAMVATSNASFGHSNSFSGSSVRTVSGGGSPAGGTDFVMNFRSNDLNTGIAAARDLAINNWRLGSVRIHRADAGEEVDVLFRQAETDGDPDNSFVGYWQPNAFSADTITFFYRTMNNIGFGQADKDQVAQHEMGHALGMYHCVVPADNNHDIRDETDYETYWRLHSVMHYIHYAGKPNFGILQHDINMYHQKWG